MLNPSVDDICVCLPDPTDSSYEETIADTYSYQRDELQAKRDNLFTEAYLLRRDFEIIQAQQCQILLQAWICKIQVSAPTCAFYDSLLELRIDLVEQHCELVFVHTPPPGLAVQHRTERPLTRQKRAAPRRACH